MPDEPRQPTEAEEDERRANAEKARAEAEAARMTAVANAEKAAAEARKATAEAVVAEIEAEADRLRMVELKHTAERAEEKRAEELAADKNHLVYNFKGKGIDGASIEACLEQLKQWKHRYKEPGRITIVFFSPGGSVIHGMALYDEILAMRQAGWHFTTVCRGYSASMGGILLQSGDVRVCGPESYILIHEISSGAVGKIGELEDEVEFIRLIQKRVNDIFVSRSGGKVTAAKLRSMYRRKDFWLDSDTALKLGIVDQIA